MIKSNVYRLSRTELARLASEEFLRSFWWIAAAIPAFGLASIIYGLVADSEMMKFMGFFALIWPFSIPARSVISSSKSSRLFTASCHVEATPDEVVFIGEYKDGRRLRYKVSTYRFKEVVRRNGMIILRTRIPGFLPVREDAFDSETDADAFVESVETGIKKWQDEVEASS